MANPSKFIIKYMANKFKIFFFTIFANLVNDLASNLKVGQIILFTRLKTSYNDQAPTNKFWTMTNNITPYYTLKTIEAFCDALYKSSTPFRTPEKAFDQPARWRYVNTFSIISLEWHSYYISH